MSQVIDLDARLSRRRAGETEIAQRAGRIRAGMSDCAYCRSATETNRHCLIDWYCPGCRARMLASLPTKQARQGWVRRWRDSGEIGMADAVVEILRTMRDKNRQEALSEARGAVLAESAP